MKKSYFNIVWEKTHNPLETIPGELFGQELPDMPEEDFGDSEFKDEMDHQIMESHQDVKCIMTPLGVIPMTEHTDPFVQFNFWTGHTNFGITNGLLKELAKVPGVEIIDVLSCTRYRFRVAIGKAFTLNPKDRETPLDRKVLNAIKKRAVKYIIDSGTWNR